MVRGVRLFASSLGRPGAIRLAGRLAGRRPLSVNQKTSTGLTGVPVVTNAREVLVGLYNRTLDEIQTIPDSARYRQGVEQITRFRLGVVQAQEDCAQIEALIQDGQVEELIEQAKAELDLIPVMAEWKPWEKPAATPAEAETGA